MTSTPIASEPGEAAAEALRKLPQVDLPQDYAREMPAYLARMAQQHGPVFRMTWPEATRVYMVGPEANRTVLHTHREYFSHDLGWTPIIGETLGRGLLTMDGAEHARHRAMMNPAFTMAYMARYLPLMGRVIGERTATWPERGEVDLYEEARKITFDVAAETLVGFSAGGQVDLLRDHFYTLLYAEPREGESEEGLWQRLDGVRDNLHRLVRELIEERRAAAPPAEQEPVDILTTMVHARDEEGAALSDEQILAHVNILLVAGHETSTSLASWVLYLLAVSPEHLARLRAEIDEVAAGDQRALGLDALRRLRFLGNVIGEVGRLYPPVGVAPRGVLRDVEFAGYTIPAGAQVRYAIAAGHRLPDVFADPLRFDPDRFAPPREEDRRTPYALVTFGGGPRICIGVNFAQVEIKALVAHVVRAYTLTPIADHEPEQLYPGITAYLPGGMPVRVRPRGLGD